MSADPMMMTAFVSHSLVAGARVDEANRVSLEAEMGAQVVKQGLIALELEEERQRELAESSRVVKRADLESWCGALEIVEDTCLERGMFGTAATVKEIREALPNAGEPFKEVPYA